MNLRLAVIFSLVVSCEGKFSVTLAKKSAVLASINSLKTVVAKPGQVVELVGKDFDASKKYLVRFKDSDGDKKEFLLTVKNSQEASFLLPDGLGLGERNFEVYQGKSKIKDLSIVTDNDSNKLPIFTASQSEMCSSVEYINAVGEKVNGLKDCSGQSVVDCNVNGQQGCKTNDRYKAADFTNITAANIKSGVVIAGVTGDYPSSTNPLTGADVTADLDAATFNAKIKSATAFEYWNSSGERQTGTGDSDITTGNIKDSVSIFGENGTYVGATPNAWDIRVGTVVAGVTGKLKVDCRSGGRIASNDIGLPKAATIDTSTDTMTVAGHGFVDDEAVRLNYTSTAPGGVDNVTTYYVRNSTTNTFQISTMMGGSALDITSVGTSVYVMRYEDGSLNIWDSIDDFSGIATEVPTYAGWSASNLCYGIETVVDDANVWKDVTTTGDGVTASDCTTSGAHCSFRDKISGHEWHRTTSTSRHWTEAVSFCDNLTFNGKTDWRLPTEKELMQAYIHGIVSTAGHTNWISSLNLGTTFWSSTVPSTNPANAWTVSLGNGSVSVISKGSTYRVICTRP